MNPLRWWILAGTSPSFMMENHKVGCQYTQDIPDFWIHITHLHFSCFILYDEFVVNMYFLHFRSFSLHQWNDFINKAFFLSIYSCFFFVVRCEMLKRTQKGPTFSMFYRRKLDVWHTKILPVCLCSHSVSFFPPLLLYHKASFCLSLFPLAFFSCYLSPLFAHSLEWCQLQPLHHHHYYRHQRPMKNHTKLPFERMISLSVVSTTKPSSTTPKYCNCWKNVARTTKHLWL